MERRPRRYWTWIVTAGASLVILAAAASGLFQLAVQAVPGYRADVERYVRELTGRPIRIAALGLSWHYYYPTLDLNGVELLGDDGAAVALRADRLRLGFSPMRLVRGDFLPDHLVVSGFTLDARVDGDGHLTVQGIAGNGNANASEALKPLARFALLRIERCRLNLRDDRRGNEVYSFGIDHAELDRGLLGDTVDADVALPVALGDSAHLEGSITGEPFEPSTWSGSAELTLAGLAPAAWLQPRLARGARLEMSDVGARLKGRIEQGHWKQFDIDAHTGPVRVHRGRFDAEFASIDARASVDVLADGWKAELDRLSLATARGTWPAVHGALRMTRTAGVPDAYDAQLSYADLADLSPWLRVLQLPEAWAEFDQASGLLHDAQFRIQGAGSDARYSYRARFETLALPAGEHAAGFAGLSGELAGDESGGRAMLQEAPLTLDLPGMLQTPTVPIEAFEGEVEWNQHDGAWDLRLPRFHWSLWSLRGNGHLALELPADHERSPVIDLAAQFTADDVTRAKPLMPQHWGPGLRSWLDHAIVSGRAARAELSIKGPLADFPFQEKATGEFKLDIDARDILLAYQPDWPSIDGLDAALAFRGNGLSIQATRGNLKGNAIKSASARFPDFQTGQLLIDGTVAGETANFYEFLARSPLQEKFRGLLTQTKATGPSAVEIHLDMPVNHVVDTQVSGRVTVDGAELRVAALPEPIRSVRGQIAFKDAAITAEALTARLYELPLEATLTPQADRTTLLDAAFHFALDPQGKGASQLVPAWLRRKVAGASDWHATFLIGADRPVVNLSTDLAGVEVKYPPPLGKTREERAPLTLGIGSLPGVPLHITVDYQNRLGADLHFSRSGDSVALERGALRAGGTVPTAGAEKGIVLGGDVAELDVHAWTGELTGGNDKSQTLRHADVHVGHAVWDRYGLRDVRYQWSAQPGGWTAVLSGTGGSGEVRWTAADRGLLALKLDALALEYAPPSPQEEEGAAASAIDPNVLPLYDVDIKKLQLNQEAIGHLQFASARIDAGQVIKTLKIDGGTVTAALTGDWRRRGGQSSASLAGDFATSDIAGLLKAFGYTPNLDAKAARIKTALAWPPAEHVEWHDAQGPVHLEFENGQLRAVDPGNTGRALGLINFYALPRRLTLNFRDVVSSGLGFDRIDGDFALKEGNARTDNLHIDGPSLKMDLRGRIGLAARDYDQQVTVYPDVSSGVTLGAVLLGGPVAGALTLIAQELLKKPLSKVSELSYRVTGSWDNPQVEKAGAAPPPANPPPPPKTKS